MGQPFGPLTPANDDSGVYSGEPVGEQKPPPWWKEDGVPETASEHSLFYRDTNGAQKFAGPTHYHHLADGRVVAGYSGGTVYSERMPDGSERLTKIIGNHEG